MARVVNEKEYAAKRNEILDVAQRLVQIKGYEQMSIQDILDELHISKGAFYHYYSSKQAVLEALTNRMVEDVEQIIIPIVYDPQLTALEKLQLYFDVIVRWKTERKPFVLELARVWFADDNAIVRLKLHATGVKRIAPLLATIVRQGIQEGVFTTPYPDQAGVIAVSLLEDLNEVLVSMLLSLESKRDDPRCLEDTVAAFTDALERVLGAPSGSLQIVDATTLKEWTFSPTDKIQKQGESMKIGFNS
ncbi:MAG: TetR/AcrR family transcriptional regulator [Chloroflexota bacterium]|jgi:TetR/AcrR family transcriptional repressor of nem operon